MMHPRVRHKHVDYRTGEVSLRTSKRGARELVYFTRGRDGRAPFSFQADYVRVMGRGSPAMYLLIYWTFSKNKNWTFLGAPNGKTRIEYSYFLDIL